MHKKCTLNGQKTHFTVIYVQKNVQLMAKVRFDGISTVSQCPQQWFIFWYKHMSLVMLFVLILPLIEPRKKCSPRSVPCWIPPSCAPTTPVFCTAVRSPCCAPRFPCPPPCRRPLTRPFPLSALCLRPALMSARNPPRGPSPRAPSRGWVSDVLLNRIDASEFL